MHFLPGFYCNASENRLLYTCFLLNSIVKWFRKQFTLTGLYNHAMRFVNNPFLGCIIFVEIVQYICRKTVKSAHSLVPYWKEYTK